MIPKIDGEKSLDIDFLQGIEYMEVSNETLLQAWMIYDKGIIYDGGTGENDTLATDEDRQDAGCIIEEFIINYITNNQ